jgi:hypothetical protein
MSAKLIPAAATRTRTSPRPGTGTGASVIRRMSCGPLREVCWRARIVAGMFMAINFPFSACMIETGPSSGPCRPSGRPPPPRKGIDCPESSAGWPWRPPPTSTSECGLVTWSGTASDPVKRHPPCPPTVASPGRLQAVIRRRMTTDNDRQQPRTTRSNRVSPAKAQVSARRVQFYDV